MERAGRTARDSDGGARSRIASERPARTAVHPETGASRGAVLAVVLLVVAALVVGAVVAWDRDALPDGVTAQLYPLRYVGEIAQAADRYDVDPFLVAAVIKTESGFDREAVSSAGATGLMQLMPETASWIAGRDDWRGTSRPDLRDPADNVELGTYYLAFLLRRFDGDLRSALAAYNAGDATVSRWLDEQGDRLGTIPFAETRGFVERVSRFYSLYQRVHPGVFAQGSGAAALARAWS